MGKLIVDGNKVYTVDEACMKRKNLTLAQIRQQETGASPGKRKPTAAHTKGNVNLFVILGLSH